MAFHLHIWTLLGLLAVGILCEDPYFTIFPKANDDNDANTRITQDLYGRIDRAKIHRSQSQHLGTMYWYAPLNDENLQRYRQDPGVRSVAAPGEFGLNISTSPFFKRAIVHEKPASTALRIITQAEGQKELPDGYYYDDSAGEDVRI